MMVHQNVIKEILIEQRIIHINLNSSRTDFNLAWSGYIGNPCCACVLCVNSKYWQVDIQGRAQIWSRRYQKHNMPTIKIAYKM